MLHSNPPRKAAKTLDNSDSEEAMIQAGGDVRELPAAVCMDRRGEEGNW